MKILGIESSSQVASVALLSDGITMAEYTVNFKLTHSQTLLPMLDEMVGRVSFDINELDAIAISEGPGSFTGLRIGAATAKGLGLALDVPLIPVPTLDAMAYGLYGANALICPMMDARRGQVYAAVYRYVKEPETVYPAACVLVNDLCEWLNKRGEEVIFLGDGVTTAAATLSEKLIVPCDFAPPHLNRQRASAVAALGEKLYNEGKAVTAAEFAPNYLRKAQAQQALEDAISEGRADELKAGHILKEE